MPLETQDSPPSALAAQSAPRSLWRQGDFMKLWIGETVSLAGSAVTELALPLTAILLLHASSLQLGLLLAFNSGAAALFGLFAGAWSDRVRRRPLMILADISRALLMGAVPLAALLGALRIEELYIVTAGTGALDSLFSAAYQGLLPALVRREQLVAANSRFEGSRVLAQVLGPGLSGALVQVLTAPFALLADAFSFLFSGACIWRIRDPQMAASESPSRASLWREIAEGLRFLQKEPLVRALLLTSLIFNLFAPVLNAQSLLFATRELLLSPLLIGLGIVGAGACGVLASSVTDAISSRLGIGRAMTLATGMICGGWLLVPFVHGTVLVALVLFTLGASIGTMGDVIYNINAVSVRQALVPDRLRGRVSASIRVLILGVQPLGALVGGVLGEQLGLRPTLLVAALGFGVGFLSMFVLPLRHLRRLDALAPDQPPPDPAPADE